VIPEWPRRVALVLLLLAAVAAAISGDPGGPPAPDRRGGYFLLAGDFHVHSFLGDGALGPWALLGEARRRGLHVFALTNHNQIRAARLARWLSLHFGGSDGPLVLVGQEVTHPRYHLAAVGLTRVVDWRVPAPQAIADIHAQGGVAIAAHPDLHYSWGIDDSGRRLLDGAELFHPLVYATPAGQAELADFRARARALQPRLAAIGSSDFHAMGTLGLCRTIVFAREVSERGVLDAIRAGRTVVLDGQRQPHGPAELVALLPGTAAAAPPPLPRPSFGGLLAWLGLLGLVVGGRRRP
jgi:hypothetical protein